MGNVYVTVSSSHQTEVFLAYTLTGSGKLGDSAYRGSLGRLTACVGVNLSIQYEDVDILTACDYMVETTVTDVVRGTVATDNPLAAFYQVLRQTGDSLAAVALVFGSFYHRNNLFSQFLALVCIVHVFNPSLEYFFVFSRSSFCCDGIFHSLHDTSAHLFVGKLHTQTEFAEVLEQ